MESHVLDQPQVGIESYRYGGFWIRFAAYLLDGIILGIVQTILGMIIIGGSIFSPEAIETAATGSMVIYYVLNLVVGILYFAGLESSNNQGTVGKMAVGVKVVDEQGQRISFGRAFGRYLAKILSALILLIGFIMAAFDSKKQALHDKLAKTYVVYKR